MVRFFILFVLTYSLSSTLVLGQVNEETEVDKEAEAEESFEMIIQHFDDLNRDWHGIKPTLDNYNGIHIYCSQESYKEIVKKYFVKGASLLYGSNEQNN